VVGNRDRSTSTVGVNTFVVVVADTSRVGSRQDGGAGMTEGAIKS
jgi:hypothetical protein